MSYKSRLVGWLASIAVTIALVGCTHGRGESARSASEPTNEPVYIGTFTGKGSQGIYLLWMNTRTGQLSAPTVAAQAQSPSYLAIPSDGKFLYSVNELDDWNGHPSGAVSAFSISNDYKTLTLLNQQPSGGRGPTYISLDHTGKVALVANYSGGSDASFPIDDEGRLKEPASVDQHHGNGPNPARQEGPHAHCFDVDPGNHFALCCDLGLDKVFVYRLNVGDGKLTPASQPSFSVPPGSGPRHLAFSRDGRFVYVINEIKSTVTVFSYDANAGSAHELETISTLPADFHGQSTCAEIAIEPSGRFLYGSNRGHDSIAIFAIDPRNGTLKPAGHVSTEGKNPRGFGIDRSGRFLIAANQDSNNLVVFKIDPKNGSLTPTEGAANVPTPVCVTFPPRK